VRYFSGWKSEWLASSVRRKAYDEIGESASAWWRVDPRVVDRGGIEHVAAVHRGVTRALFRIEPGSWETKVFGLHKSGSQIRLAAFWFQAIASGPLFDGVIGPHGHRVPPRAQGTQNPLHYWPHHPYKKLAAPLTGIPPEHLDGPGSLAAAGRCHSPYALKRARHSHASARTDRRSPVRGHPRNRQASAEAGPSTISWT
jgi:hypothetical protein